MREGLPTTSNGVVHRGFTFCRLLYQSVRREPLGHGWNTDYPGSDHNFLVRLEELTTTKPARWADGHPGYAVVRASQNELYGAPSSSCRTSSGRSVSASWRSSAYATTSSFSTR